MSMINKNNKGRGETNYGHQTAIISGRGEGKYGYPTSIVLRKVAGMGVMTVVAGVGVCAYGKARPCRKAGKNLIKFFAISIIAIVGLFVFLQGAEAAFSYNFL